MAESTQNNPNSSSPTTPNPDGTSKSTSTSGRNDGNSDISFKRLDTEPPVINDEHPLSLSALSDGDLSDSIHQFVSPYTNPSNFATSFQPQDHPTVHDSLEPAASMLASPAVPSPPAGSSNSFSGIMSIVTSKLTEVSLTTMDVALQKLLGIGNLFRASDRSDLRLPAHSFNPSYYNVYEPHLKIDLEQLEQLFYFFRSACDIDPSHFKLDILSQLASSSTAEPLVQKEYPRKVNHALFTNLSNQQFTLQTSKRVPTASPESFCLLLSNPISPFSKKVIWKLFRDHEQNRVDFACFMHTWTAILNKNVNYILDLLFDALTSSQTGKLSLYSFIKKCQLISSDMYRLGFFKPSSTSQPVIASMLPQYVEQFINGIYTNSLNDSPSLLKSRSSSTETKAVETKAVGPSNKESSAGINLNKSQFIKLFASNDAVSSIFGLIPYLFNEMRMDQFVGHFKEDFPLPIDNRMTKTTENDIYQLNEGIQWIRPPKWKPHKEGFLKKKFDISTVNKWSIKYAVVAHGFLWYYSDSDNFSTPSKVISLLNAKIESVAINTDPSWNSGISITLSDGYSRLFSCASPSEHQSWMKIIESNVTLITSHETNRYQSSFPTQPNQVGRPFVDARETYESIYHALMSAKDTIFISGWFLSPEVRLLRRKSNQKDFPTVLAADPTADATDASIVLKQPRPNSVPIDKQTTTAEGIHSEEIDSALETVLALKASQGVQIYILLWNETKIAVPTCSEYTETKLKSLIPHNLHIIRHPLLLPVNWSHHQKLCIIDQDIGYVGGIDLCFGRFDDPNHLITDQQFIFQATPGLEVQISTSSRNSNTHDTSKEHQPMWIGKDYHNPVVATFDDLSNPATDLFDRSEFPRMGWHDIHCGFFGGTVPRDLSVNFIERWNWAKMDLGKMEAPLLLPKLSHPIQLFVGENKFSDNSTQDSKLQIHIPFNLDDLCCRNLCYSKLKAQVVRSIGNWGLNNISPDTPERSIYKSFISLISQAEHFIYIETQYFVSSTADHPSVTNEVTLVLKEKIRQAIRNDIYVLQQQCSTADIDYNQLKPSFRVVIVLPIHPDGTYQNDSGIRYVMYWQYRTICRSPKSLLGSLASEFPMVDLSRYISFHSLRSWGVLEHKAQAKQDKSNNNIKSQDYNISQSPTIANKSPVQDNSDNFLVVTEQVYIHSKLMIIDDRVSFIGSANINDRSFAGDRDSEIGVIIEDQTPVDSMMAGKKFKAAKMAHDLRVSLWCEHLGLAIKDPICRTLLQDPTSEASFSLWKSISSCNTDLFFQVFPHLPDNSISTLEQLKGVQETTEYSKATLLLSKVQGHLVDFPMHFLKETTLEPEMSDIGLKLMDVEIFT